MNFCMFYGQIVDAPHMTTENGADKIELTIEVENRRKNKKGGDVIEKELLDFEAWDSAARTIYEYCEIGDYMVLQCTAKQDVFRIDTFKLLQNLQDFEHEA